MFYLDPASIFSSVSCKSCLMSVQVKCLFHVILFGCVSELKCSQSGCGICTLALSHLPTEVVVGRNVSLLAQG